MIMHKLLENEQKTVPSCDGCREQRIPLVFLGQTMSIICWGCLGNGTHNTMCHSEYPMSQECQDLLLKEEQLTYEKIISLGFREMP